MPSCGVVAKAQQIPRVCATLAVVGLSADRWSTSLDHEQKACGREDTQWNESYDTHPVEELSVLLVNQAASGRLHLFAGSQRPHRAGHWALGQLLSWSGDSYMLIIVLSCYDLGRPVWL